jgi:hypothetical protein
MLGGARGPPGSRADTMTGFGSPGGSSVEASTGLGMETGSRSQVKVCPFPSAPSG